MALLTEPTSSTTGKKRRNSKPAPSSGSDSPDSSGLLSVIESLKARIEQMEGKKELDDEEREALSEAKAELKKKKAQAANPQPNEPSASEVPTRRSIGAGFWDDEE